MIPLSIYERGHAALTACWMDQRFSYSLYVPTKYDGRPPESTEFDLVIAMHGSARMVLPYRDGFAELAERRGFFVLAPLFPIGIIEPGEVDNYKYLEFHGLRYDLVLLSMIAEVEERYGVNFRRKAIHGFSGGGQFVHRFYYLHADKLDAVSIGAPGKVTLLDETRPWWVGTQDVARRFGRPIELGALRRVKVHLVVGEDDVDEHEIRVAEESRIWMPGANDAGKNRIERLRTLRTNLEENGIRTTLDVVPGVAHSGIGKVLERAADFIDRALS